LWWKAICRDGRAVDFELMGVEEDLCDFRGDVEGDLDTPLEGKSTTEFEIVKRQLIMTWFYPNNRSAPIKDAMQGAFIRIRQYFSIDGGHCP